MPFSNDEVRKAYDTASEAYARKFLKELDQKPFDRGLLRRFADEVGRGARVLDLGCGPGHTTALLHSLDLDATGIDLSPRMVREASCRFPGIRFLQGDFFSLDEPPGSVAGLLAFYAIVHLAGSELGPAFAEMCRVIRPGGTLLLSFHAGTGVIRVDDFLETSASLAFTFFQPGEVRDALTRSGFAELEVLERDPYDAEYPSRRCYVFARKRPLS